MTSLWISKHAGSQLQQKQTFKSKKISEETSNFNAKTGYFDQKKRAGQESSGQVRPFKQRLSVARALSSLEIAGRNQSVIEHRGGQIFEGGIGLRGCWYHRTQNQKDVYNLQKLKEEISHSLTQIVQNPSTFLQ